MVAELSHLPGIGQKTAQRLAYHIVSMPLDDVRALATAIWQGRKAIRYCQVCGNYAAGDTCGVCADPERHNGQICVVRDPRAVAAMERMHDYHGLYHVLHGTLSPMDGVTVSGNVSITAPITRADASLRAISGRLLTEGVSIGSGAPRVAMSSVSANVQLICSLKQTDETNL